MYITVDTPTSVPTFESCPDCLSGSGPCIFDPLGRCEGYLHPETRTCVDFYRDCDTNGTPLVFCDDCIGSSFGPCHIPAPPGVPRLCALLDPGTGQCPVGTSLCDTKSPTDTPSDVPTTSPSDAPSDAPTWPLLSRDQ